MVIFKHALGDICKLLVILLVAEGSRRLGEKVAEMFPPSHRCVALSPIPSGLNQ